MEDNISRRIPFESSALVSTGGSLTGVEVLCSEKLCRVSFTGAVRMACMNTANSVIVRLHIHPDMEMFGDELHVGVPGSA